MIKIVKYDKNEVRKIECEKNMIEQRMAVCQRQNQRQRQRVSGDLEREKKGVAEKRMKSS